MLNTIIQKSSVWGDFAQNMPQNHSNFQTNVTYQTTLQEKLNTTTTKTVYDTEIQMDEPKKPIGAFVKILAFAAVTIGAIWGIPALNKAILKKEETLPIYEKELSKKMQTLISKGAEAIESEKKHIEKTQKSVNFQKKIFEKINKTPILKNIKNKFSRCAQYIESKIQKPIKTLMQKYIFGFVKK